MHTEVFRNGRHASALLVAALAAMGVYALYRVSAGLAAGALALTVLGIATWLTVLATRDARRARAIAREEAQTDPLTGLGNRPRLTADLRREIEAANVSSPRVLVLFDLDGFKRFNDAFGHSAGDELLARLARNLERAVKPYGWPYRIGGDEFALLVTTGASSAKTIISLATGALSEQGEGYAIKPAHGTALLPHEARDATLALRVADQRMYAHKESRRSSSTQQTRDILLQVLYEREPALGRQLKSVADLARGVGARLGLIPEELDELVRAAELHDVGKTAIPDEILHKPGPLSPEEWEYVRRHPLVGERILSVAPALLPVARIVRASHERWDGSGYPDGIAGEEIPLGARIIAVCDAFEAMTTPRAYRPPRSTEEALHELRACAGTQFDSAVVDAFCKHVQPDRPPAGRGPAVRVARRPAAP